MNKVMTLERVEPCFLHEQNVKSEIFANLFTGFNELELNGSDKTLKESNGYEDFNVNKKVLVKTRKNYEFNKLTNEELCAMYKKGNKSILDVLMKKNERLVWSRVVKYRVSYKHKLDDEDLFQYGCMGLLMAIEKYDIKREIKLSTYAIWWIDQQILRSIADYGFTVRVPVHIFDQIRKVTKIMRKSMDASEEELLEIAKSEGVGKDKFNNLLDILNNVLLLSSINSIVGNDEESELESFIEDKTIMTVEEEVERINLKDCIQYALSTLTPKEETVIKLRFGLEDGKQRTLEEIGGEFKLTRERIRQIETKALKKLRQANCTKKLRDFVW